MKVVRITAWQPECEGAPTDWRTMLGQILVEVELESGVVGLGVGGGGIAGIHIIETVIKQCLHNATFDTPREAHERMVAHTSFYGRKGIVPMAISGVDLALWDAAAKIQNKSVYELLTDKPAPSHLAMYQTVFDDSEAMNAVANGKQAVKLHVERFGDRPDSRSIKDLVRITREKLGPKKSIMVDAFGRWDVPTTMEVAEAIYEFDVDWIEEPVGPESLADYAELNQKCPIAIAGGEHEYLRDGFEELAKRKAVSVFQPDINWCGGLTTLIDIYAIAREHSIRVVPHRGAEAYSLPAIAALDENPLAESARTWFNCLEGMPSASMEGVELQLAPGFGVSIAPNHQP